MGFVISVDPTSTAFKSPAVGGGRRPASLPTTRPADNEYVKRLTFVWEQFHTHSYQIRLATGFRARTVAEARTICYQQNRRLGAGQDRLTFRIRWAGKTILY